MEYNKENYNKQIAEINREAEARKTELVKLYASENNPYKVGDVVTDHIGSIIVEKITCSRDYYKFPYCVYYGLELKKDGTPRKDKSKRSVHQLNTLIQILKADCYQYEK